MATALEHNVEFSQANSRPEGQQVGEVTSEVTAPRRLELDNGGPAHGNRTMPSFYELDIVPIPLLSIKNEGLLKQLWIFRYKISPTELTPTELKEVLEGTLPPFTYSELPVDLRKEVILEVQKGLLANLAQETVAITDAYDDCEVPAAAWEVLSDDDLREIWKDRYQRNPVEMDSEDLKAALQSLEEPIKFSELPQSKQKEASKKWSVLELIFRWRNRKAKTEESKVDKNYLINSAAWSDLAMDQLQKLWQLRHGRIPTEMSYDELKESLEELKPPIMLDELPEGLQNDIIQVVFAKREGPKPTDLLQRLETSFKETRDNSEVPKALDTVEGDRKVTIPGVQARLSITDAEDIIPANAWRSLTIYDMKKALEMRNKKLPGNSRKDDYVTAMEKLDTPINLSELPEKLKSVILIQLNKDKDPSLQAWAHKRFSKIERSIRPGEGFGKKQAAVDKKQAAQKQEKDKLGRRGAMKEVLAEIYGLFCEPPGFESNTTCAVRKIKSGQRCGEDINTFLVDGKIGFCAIREKHNPGTGVVDAVAKVLSQSGSVANMIVLGPTGGKRDKEVQYRQKNRDLLDTVEREIVKATISGYPPIPQGSQRCTRSRAEFDMNGRTSTINYNTNGLLYCYFVTENGESIIPTRDRQIAYKCGFTTFDRLDVRMKEHSDSHKRSVNNKGTVHLVAAVRIPFKDSVDSYTQSVLKWWNLPTRYIAGGTEWYHISLNEVLEIWRAVRDDVMDLVKKHNVKLDQEDDWYMDDTFYRSSQYYLELKD